MHGFLAKEMIQVSVEVMCSTLLPNYWLHLRSQDHSFSDYKRILPRAFASAVPSA